MKTKKGIMARILLASIGGMASMVAGLQGHYKADYQTPKKEGRSRVGRGNYGRNLKKNCDSKAFAGSGRAERHQQYLADQAARKAARTSA